MIKVTYKDDSIKKYHIFKDIINNNSVIKINCNYNLLKDLPDNMHFPNLQTLFCKNNNLRYLSKNMNLSNLESLDCRFNNLRHLPKTVHFNNLQELYCNNNNLSHLPDTINLPNLQILNCSENQLTYLQENMILPNLQILNCSGNQLTYLPANMNLPNLGNFICSKNQLTHLPENINLPNLYFLDCSINKLIQLSDTMNLPNLSYLRCCFNNLTHLPLCILNFHHLEYINYDNNPIELSPQIARFIERIQNGSMHNLNVYNDTENIHNTTIQLSVKSSINNITSRLDLPKYELEALISLILEDSYLDCKDNLIDYCNDDSVHTLLLLTFSEVVWFTLQTIHKDFKIETQAEIKKILNQEMKDAECKCFTGRMNRVVNCLNGFTPLVIIQIQDSEQIGNIIFIIKEQLESSKTYTIETHKELVSKEMTERGYTKESIDIWIKYIE